MSTTREFNKLSASMSSASSSQSSNISRTSSAHHQTASTSFNDLQKNIFSALAKCEENMYQLAYRKFILKHVENLVRNNTNIVIDENDKDVFDLRKVQQILDALIVLNNCELPTKYKDKDEDLRILGLFTPPKPPELNDREKNQLKMIVEKELLKSINSYINKYEERGGNVIEAMKNKDTPAKQQLLTMNELEIAHWKNKIDELCNQYSHDVYVFSDLLDEWQSLKYRDLEDLNYKKAQAQHYDAQILELQTKITKAKYTLEMFHETPETVEAFRELYQKLDEKFLEVKHEIKMKKSLIKQYDDLRGTAYDDLLNRYLRLRSAIEKYEHIVNSK